MNWQKYCASIIQTSFQVNCCKYKESREENINLFMRDNTWKLFLFFNKNKNKYASRTYTFEIRLLFWWLSIMEINSWQLWRWNELFPKSGEVIRIFFYFTSTSVGFGKNFQCLKKKSTAEKKFSSCSTARIPWKDFSMGESWTRHYMCITLWST